MFWSKCICVFSCCWIKINSIRRLFGSNRVKHFICLTRLKNQMNKITKKQVFFRFIHKLVQLWEAEKKTNDYYSIGSGSLKRNQRFFSKKKSGTKIKLNQSTSKCCTALCRRALEEIKWKCSCNSSSLEIIQNKKSMHANENFEI